MTFSVFHSGDEVSIIKGTVPCRSHRYQSWKQFWIHKSNRHWPDECRIAGCTNTTTDGAHVMVKARQQLYILPTCHHCNVNRPGRWLPVNVNSVAVLVSESDTEGDGNCY